jgi:hypothetical protein
MYVAGADATGPSFTGPTGTAVRTKIESFTLYYNSVAWTAFG